MIRRKVGEDAAKFVVLNTEKALEMLNRKFGDGAPCVFNGDCEHEVCSNVRFGKGVCKPLSGFENGHQCGDGLHDHCASGFCDDTFHCQEKMDQNADCHGLWHAACKSNRCEKVRETPPRVPVEQRS